MIVKVSMFVHWSISCPGRRTLVSDALRWRKENRLCGRFGVFRVFIFGLIVSVHAYLILIFFFAGWMDTGLGV